MDRLFLHTERQLLMDRHSCIPILQDLSSIIRLLILVCKVKKQMVTQ